MDENCSLAELVVDEHDLQREDVELVKLILTDNKHKVLLLFDGYDEYTPGTNTELDTAIKKKMDGEVVIEGFSEKNIKKCCSRYLGSKREAKQFLKEASKKLTSTNYFMFQSYC